MNSETQPLIPKPPSSTNVKSSSSAWLSVYIASALSFIGSAQYTMYFSSLWPYLQVMAQRRSERKITENFFGYIVAIYSAGQIISSPIFGYWSNHIRQVRIPIIVGMLLMLIGNVIYLGMEFVSFPGYVLLVSRFVIGFGSGNVVLMRSYAATALDESERARALTFVTCGQAVGLTVGPALQLLFTPLHYPGFSILGIVHLHLYTAPAIFSNLMNFVGTCAMIWCFEEKFAGIMEPSDADNAENAKRQLTLPPYDLIALTVCLVTRFTYTFINTNLETIGSPYSMMMFEWTEEKAVFYTSIAQSLVGFLTLSIYVVLIYWKLDKHVNYRLGSTIGLTVMVLFHVTTYSWPFLPGTVTQAHPTNQNDSTVGCDADKFEWCGSLRPVNLWFYYSTYVLALGLAFPVLNISNTTLFSDVLGPRRQGIQQGVFQMSGGAARLIGPILISNLYSTFGPTMAWNMEIVVILLTLVLWFVFFNRMVALEPLLPVESLYKMSAVDVAPDPSALSSSSQVHSVPRKTKSELLQTTDPLLHSNVERTQSNRAGNNRHNYQLLK